jgi:hypothetical protein
MLKKYGILGSGDASDNVIEDALIEVGEDNEFVVGCPTKPGKALTRALEWLIDNEVPYRIVCTEGTPAKFVDSAIHCEYLTSGVEERVIEMLQKAKGTLLLIWDDNNIETTEKICFESTDAGVNIRDLSNGLVPIRVADAPKDTPVEPVERHVPTAEIEVEPFSKEEMLSMSIGVLRKTAKTQGVSVTPDMSKEDIVNAILWADEDELADYQPPIELGTFHVVSSAQSDRAVTSGVETCMITAVFPSGIIMSRAASPYEVKQLFGFDDSTT